MVDEALGRKRGWMVVICVVWVLQGLGQCLWCASLENILKDDPLINRKLLLSFESRTRINSGHDSLVHNDLSTMCPGM